MRATDRHGRPVELTKIASDCYRGDCPTVSLTDRGTAAIQGDVLQAETPGGEGVIEIPLKLLLEAARALG